MKFAEDQNYQLLKIVNYLSVAKKNCQLANLYILKTRLALKDHDFYFLKLDQSLDTYKY